MSINGKGQFIGGTWLEGAGTVFHSINPATGQTVWSGHEAGLEDVTAAIRSARKAFFRWSDHDFKARAKVLEAFAVRLKKETHSLAELISEETGKPLWESIQEVETMIGKIANSLDAYAERSADSRMENAGFIAAKRYRPHGVVAVLGPFNLPGHLPHSHVVPALLAGNTVVYKPSELTPGVAERTTEYWRDAGLPAGVLNLVQGGRAVGAALAAHPDLDGLFFTGSYTAGVALNRLFADHPGKILALEMGGNNPLVIWEASQPEASALLVAQSAFLTSGQRCVCARRLIVENGASGQKHMDALLALLPRLRVGAYTDKPEPFMGPLINVAAADRVLAGQAALEKAGGKILVPARRLEPGNTAIGAGAFLSPGIIDMTEAEERPDEEYFGPLLQVIRADDFDAALAEANRTRFGLAAGLISDSVEKWEWFRNRVRAGVVNWNRQTTGASGRLPFGGVGDSGNHRPSAYYAADYCAYPVASLESEKATVPAKLPLGINGIDA